MFRQNRRRAASEYTQMPRHFFLLYFDPVLGMRSRLSLHLQCFQTLNAHVERTKNIRKRVVWCEYRSHWRWSSVSCDITVIIFFLLLRTYTEKKGHRGTSGRNFVWVESRNYLTCNFRRWKMYNFNKYVPILFTEILLMNFKYSWVWWGGGEVNYRSPCVPLQNYMYF